MLIDKNLLKGAGVSDSQINKYLPYLQTYALTFGVTTRSRVIAFLANVLLESTYFRVVEESFAYKRDRLLKVFPKYFNEGNVDKYVGKPQAIANRVYANRLGNGDEKSGDGFKHRGFGVKQVTGKYNQEAFAKFASIDISADPSIIAKNPEYAVLSAFWFWSSNGLNMWADKITTAKTPGEITKAYKDVASIINTGKPGRSPNGWADREIIRTRLEKLIPKNIS